MSLKSHLCAGCMLVLTASAPFARAHAQDASAALRPLADQWERLAAAEDARARTPDQLAVILGGLQSREAEMRRLAVRALGRLERPVLADTIARVLRDESPRVRAEAAHALGQALSRADGSQALPLLSSALAAERDPAVRAAIAETLGRLRYATATQARTALELLLPLTDSSQTVALGAVRGLYFLVRQQVARPEFNAAVRTTLLHVATAPAARPSDTSQVRLRTVAAATLVATGGADAAALSAILRDGTPFVRREAAAALAARADTAATAPLVMQALSDASAVVRLEALRAYGRRFAVRGCDPVLRDAKDENAHVALLAIDLLGSACAATAPNIAMLDSLAVALTATGGNWHNAAHALVSLAARAPDRARMRLPSFSAHPDFFVRAYAATAAVTLRDTAALMRLSGDAHANVRTIVVEGLNRLLGHEADSLYIAQLTQDDSQLLQAAAAALDSTRLGSAPVALLDALDRLSAARRETSRDARVALLLRAQQLGNASLAARLQPYVTDIDSAVARRAADALQAWTGTRPVAAPVTLPALAMPTFEQTAALARATALIHLADGGEIELQLLPFDAPTNAARFARLASNGYFNGLSFHRIAPNFVVQGGSPHANEYAGDGPFTRDELALENWRGTVGISTRGRDTGDAQIYINLIDNVRLDHDYTVFARVVRGMERVDRLLEGARIRTISIR